MSLDIAIPSSVAFTASSPLSSWWCPEGLPQSLETSSQALPTSFLIPQSIAPTCGFKTTKNAIYHNPPTAQTSNAFTASCNGRVNVNSRKADFVESLVDTTASIIESIWPHHSYSAGSRLLPLRRFIQEILRRSKTSFSTLQLALLYLVRLRKSLTPFVRPNDLSTSSLQQSSSSPHPSLCGRRMFLASLIVAAKYLQDRNYSNHAWAKISGLPLREINSNEREFLKGVKYELYVSNRTFVSWSTVLLRKACDGLGGSEQRSGMGVERVGEPKGVCLGGVDASLLLTEKSKSLPAFEVAGSLAATHLPSPALTDGSDVDAFPESTGGACDNEPYIRMEALCEQVGMAEFCSMLPSPELSPQVVGQKRSADGCVLASSGYKRAKVH